MTTLPTTGATAAVEQIAQKRFHNNNFPFSFPLAFTFAYLAGRERFIYTRASLCLLIKNKSPGERN